MRLFLGIDLPWELKKQIHDYLLPMQLSPKGWEHPHDYHQTLLFIGEVSDEDVDEIQSRLTEIVFSEFILTTSEFRFFPRRIMYLSFRPSHELMRLKQLVDMTFPEWGNRSEKPFPPCSFTVSELCLYKSEKDSENRKYHIIGRKNFI